MRIAMFPFTFNNALRFLPAATGTQTRKTPSVEKLLMLALFIGFMFSSMSSMAGAGGTEFTQVYDRSLAGQTERWAKRSVSPLFWWVWVWA